MTRSHWLAVAWVCAVFAANIHAFVDARSDTPQVDNRVGRFEAFYTAAVATQLDPDARILTQRAEQMARTLFAWDNELLGTTEAAINTRLILFMGQFDNNAFTAPPMDGKPATVVMPVENINLRIVLAHELTHSIHLQLIHAKNAFGAPVGETVFLEGLAMRTSERAVPGLPDASYVAMPGDTTWYPICLERRRATLAGIQTDLDKAGPAIAMKYTFGKGNTCMQREAYRAGWIVMGRLLDSGMTLPQLARIREDRMVQTIRSAMKAD